MEKTPNLQLLKPAINGEETENVWGFDLNTNFDLLDQWATTLAPLQHQHPISDIIDLQADLDAKANTQHYHQSTAITDFPTATYAQLKRDLRPGPNIGIVPDDNAQTLTISAAGGGSGGSGVVDGDKGDIIVSNIGVDWNFDPTVVTAFARTLLDDADLAAAQATLGFATLQTDIAARVLKAGDTMTGPLVLAGNPTAPLQAAPKQYVDSKAGGAAINDGPPANPVHGQMWWESDTGGLFLFYDDGTSAQWVQINAGVAGATLAGVVIGDGPPANPAPGQLWWESDTGLLFVFYNDGNTTQWVQVNSVSTGVPEAPLGAGNYVRSNGAWVGASYHGQCQLRYVDSNTIRLLPKDGNKLIINGVMQSVPSAGVSLAVTGLSASGVLYYIYAFMNGATMTLEASATGHSQDPATGVEIKSGDPTRTLVGMAWPGAGPAFFDDDTYRLVRSWFHDPGFASTKLSTSTITTGSTTPLEIDPTATRVYFLPWIKEVITDFQSIVATNNTIVSNITGAVGWDNATPIYPIAYVTASAIGDAVTLATTAVRNDFTETMHYAVVLGWADRGQSQFSAGLSGQRVIGAGRR